MNSQDNAQAGLFDWGTPAWMQPDPESTPTSDRANGDVGHAIGHVVSRGFTERQARFLLLVARHSGVCVMRQYATFGGVVFGHTTRRFFAKLERLGWVSTYDCARKRARIYHVRHRELYEAIGAPESRLRRPPTVPRVLERLMLLDVVLADPDLIWLSTPEEKLAHVSVLTSIKPDVLPQAPSPLGSHEPARYFPDHAPIGIHPHGRWVVVCLLTQDGKRELRTFVEPSQRTWRPSGCGWSRRSPRGSAGGSTDSSGTTSSGTLSNGAPVAIRTACPMLMNGHGGRGSGSSRASHSQRSTLFGSPRATSCSRRSPRGSAMPCSAKTPLLNRSSCRTPTAIWRRWWGSGEDLAEPPRDPLWEFRARKATESVTIRVRKAGQVT